MPMLWNPYKVRRSQPVRTIEVTQEVYDEMVRKANSEPNANACEARCVAGFYCTLTAGHDGDHIACGGEADICTTWSADPTPIVEMYNDLVNLLDNYNQSTLSHADRVAQLKELIRARAEPTPPAEEAHT